MKYAPNILILSSFLSLCACSAFAPVPLHPGEPEAQILAKLGPPTHRYQDGDDHLLEYMTGPWGQTTYMARISADGKLISYNQALSAEYFARIRVGQSTKDDVLRTIGAPSATSYLTLPKLEVWSYPYRENKAWDSVMHVHFDDAGTVRMLQNGPDRRRTPGLGRVAGGL